MKPFLQIHLSIALLFGIILVSNTANAQCSGVLKTTAINWDYQYYNNASLPGSGINFMMGKNTMTLGWSNTTFKGIVNEHTAMVGNDVKFTLNSSGTPTVTLTFMNPVENLKFTLQDVDCRYTVAPTAKNASNVPQVINLSKPSGGTSGISFNNTTTPTFYYGTSNVVLNSNAASINVSIAGPVSTVTLSFTKGSGTPSEYDIYLSDISACTNSTWATDYQAISAPETGQPTHMLVGYDSIIYVINRLDNTATELFADASVTRLNTMAYDPYKQIIYYCDSKRDASNKTVFKYDVKTGIKSTLITNVNSAPFNIQTFAQGLATAGAGFYDGYLFLGTDSDLNDNTPAAIYRIDIDASGNAIRASRFWGVNSQVPGTGGVNYDWGDFVVNDGVLYNFNGAVAAAAGTALEYFDLNAQSKLAGYSYAPDTLSQAALDYEGKIYSLRIGQYYQELDIATGTFGPKIFYSGIPTTRVITDGAESFKYPYDYGDAPSSYGYASHVFRVPAKINLTIGTKIDYEMASFYSAGAKADDDDAVSDEDGVNVAYFTSNPIFNTDVAYTLPVRATNKTGAAAYMFGYLDFNGNGVFDKNTERSQMMTVPDNSNNVLFNLQWKGLTGGKAGNSFVRIRISSDSTELRYGSGYAKSGEVEDYQIPINANTLPVELIAFTAEGLENNTAKLIWSTASEFNNDYFEMERSDNDNNWSTIGKVKGNGNSFSLINYSFIDEKPENGTNYYRLKQVDFDGTFKYSSVVAVSFTIKSNIAEKNDITIYPNPTNDVVWVKSSANVSQQEQKQIDVFDTKGQQLYSAPQKENVQQIDLKYYENGMYYIKIGNQSYRIIKN